MRLFALLIFLSLTLISCRQEDVIDYKGDIEKIIKAMSLEEKVDFVGGYKSFSTRPLKKYGIPQVRFADGPLGIRKHGTSIAYPANVALAAAWDRDLANNYGQALANDAKSKNVQLVLGPALNIYRFPLSGRNFEYMGEDPYLAGQIAKEVVLGLQSKKIIATAKHFLANNSEYDRHRLSSEIDERTLHEIYLPAFKSCVTEANVGSIMTSYNRINGIHASQHDYLINQVLKENWKFEGFVMSDWRSTYDGIVSAKAGLDLEMPSGKYMNKETLIDAINEGKLDKSVVDDKVRRILHVYKNFSFLDKKDEKENFKYDKDVSRKVALEIARKGIVLLKNKNNILPLQKEKINSIAIIGPNGYPNVSGGGGSSFTNPMFNISLVETIADYSSAIKLEYIKTEKEKFFAESFFENSELYLQKKDERPSKIKANYFDNQYFEGASLLEKEFYKLPLTEDDLWDEIEPNNENSAIKFSFNFKPDKSGFYLFGVESKNKCILKINDKPILRNSYSHTQLIKTNLHKLIANTEYKVELEYHHYKKQDTLKIGATFALSDQQYFNDAIEAANKADVVLMPVGFNKETEGEGFDRSFEMPNYQSELINKVAEFNKNVIVILNSGGNVKMTNWINNVNALIHSWYPGGEGSIAVAEIIFGEISPSGKLPMSFAYELEDYPTYNSYFDNDKDLKVEYSEGIFLGYRYWDQSDKKPRFPFGYGLSYTSFEYLNLKTDKKQYSSDEVVEISLQIKNTGNFDGEEIVQIYVSDIESSLPRPIKELKDFARIKLKVDEIKNVSFKLKKEDFSFYNPVTNNWELEPGRFEILAASSSKDVRLKKAIVIK